jgi:hypothetical protein
MEAPMTVRNYSLLAKLWRGVYTLFFLILFSAAHAQSGFEQVGSFPGDSFEAMQLRGNYAYTTGSGVLLTIYDVSNMRRLYQLPAPSTDMFGYQVVLASNYAYVLTAYKGRPGGAIKVVDVSNPSSPRVVGEYTGGSFDGLIVNGNIGYVSRGSQLHVLNLSNPATPQLIRTVTLSASLGGDGGTVVGNRLYLCESTAGLSVWDVSQPDNPQRLGIIGNIGVARAVHVSGNYAFVAAGQWLGGIQGGLRVIDVSDPANMSMVNFVPEGNNPTAPLVRVDNYLYMPIFDPAQYSIVFDISNPASPQFAGSLDGQLGGADSSSNHAVSFRRSKLYLYDITNRNNPVLRSTYTGRTPYAIAYRAGFVFTAEDGLFGVYDVNNPASITGAGAAVLPGEPSYAPRVQVQDNLAVVSYYFGDLTKAVTLLDVSNPRNPSILSHYGANTNVEDIALTGNILFVAHVNGLDVVDISNRLSPTRVLRQSTSYSNHPVALDVGGVGGNLLYSADYDRKLRIYDVSNPASPVLRGEVEVASASYVADVAVSGDRAIVTLSNGDAVVVNVADPTQPQVVTRWDNPREAMAKPRVQIADGIAYITDGSTLSAFDLSLLPVFSPVAQWQGSAYHAVSAGGLVFVAAGEGGLYALQRGTGGEFSVQEVAPSQAAPVGTVRVNVFGGGFQDGATFRLERNGDRVDATDVQFVSAGQLAGTLNVDGKPDESVWDVVVRNPDGRVARKGAAFLIAYPRPVVTGVSPTSAINVGQVELTVSGSNFEEGATFWLERDSERIDAVNVTRVDAARLRGTVDLGGKPENSLWDVVVRNPSGKTGRLPQAFTIQRAVPVIESVTPGQALPRSQTLTIRGRAFVSGARVEFRPFDTGLSPLAASAVQVSSQFEIQATFDFSAYRDYLQRNFRLSGRIVVSNPNGEEASRNLNVTAPSVDFVVPYEIVVDPAEPQPLQLELRGVFDPTLPVTVQLRSDKGTVSPAQDPRVEADRVVVTFSAADVVNLAPSKGYWYWQVVVEQDGYRSSRYLQARWPVWLDSVSPNIGYWNQLIGIPLTLQVYGAGFDDNVQVFLDNGAVRVAAERLSDISSYALKAQFNLSNLPNTAYDVVLKKGRAEVRLRSALSLETPQDDPINVTTWAAPTDLRINRPASFTLSVSGRVPLPPQLIRIYVQGRGSYWIGSELAPGRMYDEYWLLTEPLDAWREFPYRFFVLPYGEATGGGVVDTLKADWINPRNPFDWEGFAAEPPANVPAEEWRSRVLRARERIGTTVQDVLNYLYPLIRNLPDPGIRSDFRALLAYAIFGASVDSGEFPMRGRIDALPTAVYLFNGLNGGDATKPNLTNVSIGIAGSNDYLIKDLAAKQTVQNAQNIYILTHGYGGYFQNATDPTVAKRDDFNRLAQTIKQQDPNAVVLIMSWDSGATKPIIFDSGKQVGPSSQSFAAQLQAIGIDTTRQKVTFIGESYGTYVNGGIAQQLAAQGNYNPNNVNWIGCNPASEKSGQSPFTWVDKNLFNVAVALQTNSLADTQFKGFADYHLYLKTDKTDTVGLHTSGITALTQAINADSGWLTFSPEFVRKLESGKTDNRVQFFGGEGWGFTYDGTLDAASGQYNPDEKYRILNDRLVPTKPKKVPSAPDQNLQVSHNFRTWGSRDPNEKVGSAGFGARNYINAGASIGYTIFFENVATATGAAQTVVITDRIDPALYDLSTFSFGPMWVGGRLINTPPSGTTFRTEVDLRPANNLLLRITGNLNTVTGWIEWRFESIDPETGSPTQDPLAGFLPPNQNPPDGEGWVTFSVRPKPDLSDGTELRNTATIVFDENEPIQTNVVVHTIDAAPPTARVSALPETQSLPRFVVRWTGEDTGSGVAEYSVYYREDGGPWQQWIGATSRTEAVFVGRFGSSYEFKVRAKDYLGNEEPDSDEPEAQTRVGQAPTIPAGLRLVTLPVFTESRDTRATLNTEPAQIAWFDPTTNQYTIAPAAETVFQPGRAFWVRLTQDTQPNITGELPAMHQPFAVNLQPGWNLVGNPWLTEWEWNVQAIQVQHNGQTVSLNDASNLVEPYAWRWDGSQYQLVYDASILNGVTNRVQAWEGVWMFAQQPVRLLISPPSTRAASSGRASRGEKSGWSVTLFAQAQGKVGQVLFGAAEGTRGLSVTQPPSPPGGEAGLQIRLIRNGHPLLADVRTDTRSTRNTWEVEVQVPAGDDDRATLWWQNVHRAPRGVNPVLVDLQTGERRFLRHTSSYTFAVSRQGGTYRFRIEMVPQGELLRITNVRVSGGRSQGAYTLSFDVNAGAQLEVNVLSAGKVVRRLMNTIARSAGIQQVSWDGRDAQGIALPAGAYMLEVKATGTDGQVARVTVPVVLTR